jgi:hypothetical protein
MLSSKCSYHKKTITNHKIIKRKENHVKKKRSFACFAPTRDAFRMRSQRRTKKAFWTAF